MNKKTVRISACALAAILAGCGALEYSAHATYPVDSVYEAETTALSENTKAEEAGAKDTEDTENLDAQAEALFDTTTEKKQDIDKDETVYILTDASGKVDRTIVSEHLLNQEGKQRLEDTSVLDDIENVEGDETFTRDGEKLTWEAGGKDIYYQGTTTETAPLTQSVTYTLDGKKVKPEKLGGESGHVTIRFDYENHTTYTALVNGKKTQVNVPLAAVTCILVPEGWSNVKVTNGQVLASGNSDMIVGYCLPGMKKSLGIQDKDLTEDIDIPEYVEIEADVQDFELSTCMTAVVNAGDLLENKNADTSDLDEMLAQFGDAGDELCDGSRELCKGLDELKSKLPEFASGMQSVSDGSATLQSGMNQLNTKVPTLARGVNDLKTGMDAAYAGNAQILAGYKGDGTAANPGLCAGASSVAAGAEQLEAGVDATVASMTALQSGIATQKQQILAGVNASLAPMGVSVSSSAELEAVVAQAPNLATNANINQAIGSLKVLESMEAQLSTPENAAKLAALKQGAGDLTIGAKQVSAGVDQMAEGTEGLQNGLTQLDAGVTTLAANVPTLQDGTAQLSAGSEALADGAKQLNTATGQIVDGVGKLDDGSHALADGMTEFNESGIRKLLESYDGDIKPVLNRLEAVKEASENYHNFCGIADGAEGHVKFIYKLASIKN